MAVERPGEAGARFRHEEAKRWIRDDVDPRPGRAQAFLKDGHIFAAILREAAQAVKEFEVRHRRRNIQTFALAQRSRRRRCRSVRALRPSDLLGQCAPPAEQHHPRDSLQQRTVLHRDQVCPQEDNLAAYAAGVRGKPQLAAAHERFQGALQLLSIRRRLFIHDDHVGGQLLHTPVFMRAEQLPDDLDILRVVDARQHNGQIAGDAVGPQCGTVQRAPAEHIRGRP